MGFLSFAEQSLNPVPENVFLGDFLAFQREIAHYGILNSLSQTLLKLTVPGVPDIYQGTELWDLSFVDLDNRRPVDYDLRAQYLKQIREQQALDLPGLIHDLLTNPEGGRLKLFILERSLHLRKRYPDLFENGEYTPLRVSGKHRNHLVAFARRTETACLIALVPRRFVPLVSAPIMPLGNLVWEDTAVDLSSLPRGAWRSAFDRSVSEHGLELRVATALETFPIALLTLTT